MYTVAQPVKIKKIYHNGNHLEDKGNFCLSGSGDGTDVDISGYCEYIIEQHDDERGDSVLHQCFVVGVKSDNPIITKQCDSYQRKPMAYPILMILWQIGKTPFCCPAPKRLLTKEPLVAPKELTITKRGWKRCG